MSSISSVGSNNPYQAQTPVAKTGGVDADGDNDGTRTAAAPAPASNAQPQPPKPTDTMGNSVNTYA